MSRHFCPSCSDDPRIRGTHNPLDCRNRIIMTGNELPPQGHDPKAAVASPKQRIASCVPPVSIIEEARAMAFGAFTKGYGPFNWRGKKLSMNVYLDAIMRHLLALLDGEDIAADSKVHHLSHIKAGCGILLDALHNGELTDDRPKAGKAAELLAAPPHVEPHRPSRAPESYPGIARIPRDEAGTRSNIHPPTISSEQDCVADALEYVATGVCNCLDDTTRKCPVHYARGGY